MIIICITLVVEGGTFPAEVSPIYTFLALHGHCTLATVGGATVTVGDATVGGCLLLIQDFSVLHN